MIAAFRAAWVLPMVSAPIADGGVIVERGRVVDVGPWPAIEAHVAAREQAGVRVARRDAGHAALMPGLVNAHTHLELSWLHGMVPPAASLAAWVAASMRLRRDAPDPTPALVAAIAAARAAGTSVVGDVANGWSSIAPLERSELRAVVFHELLGFDVDPASDVVAAARERALGATGERVSVTLAAHAPYSTSPALLREIAVAVQDLTPCVMSVHVAESADETEFIATGRGAWRVMLDALGRWTPAWQPPGASPVAYLGQLGVLGRDTLVVHATQCTDADLAMLARAGAAVVTCPRSNVWVGAGVPPVAAMVAAGVRLAIGTDSLASNDDLNVFGELRALHDLAPEVPVRRWLEAATIDGARALRQDRDYGSLEPGKRADLLRVALDGPASTVPAVEDELVSGVTPARLEWVR